MLLLMAFLLRYRQDLWSDLRTWDHLSESGWMLFSTAARLLRLMTSAMVVIVIIRYAHHHRVSFVSAVARSFVCVGGCLSLAYAFRQMGMIRPVYHAPSV